jgi:hypothetical protein
MLEYRALGGLSVVDCGDALARFGLPTRRRGSADLHSSAVLYCNVRMGHRARGRSAPGDRERAARIAFFEAGNRLLQAGSFAYRGEVHAAEQSSFPPRGWKAGDVVIEGAVALKRGLTP